MNNSKRLCIVPCGTAKIWDKEPQAGPTQAQFVYTGVFASACQKYAKAFFKNWVILSAKHGFLFPEEIINESYNVSFIKHTDETITTEELIDQAREKGLMDFNEIIVLGGKHYVNRTKAIFDHGQQIILPLSDCKGIGYMLQKLTRSLESKVEMDRDPSNPKQPNHSSIETTEQPQTHIGKYSFLFDFLNHRDQTELEMTLQQIESILRFTLPASAHKHRAWWSNDVTHSQAKAWLFSNWEVHAVSLPFIKFRRKNTSE
jgi:hypothetical protein